MLPSFCRFSMIIIAQTAVLAYSGALSLTRSKRATGRRTWRAADGEDGRLRGDFLARAAALFPDKLSEADRGRGGLSKVAYLRLMDDFSGSTALGYRIKAIWVGLTRSKELYLRVGIKTDCCSTGLCRDVRALQQAALIPTLGLSTSVASITVFSRRIKKGTHCE